MFGFDTIEVDIALRDAAIASRDAALIERDTFFLNLMKVVTEGNQLFERDLWIATLPR